MQFRLVPSCDTYLNVSIYKFYNRNDLNLVEILLINSDCEELQVYLWKHILNKRQW